jgi:anti-anti-sigma factor
VDARGIFRHWESRGYKMITTVERYGDRVMLKVHEDIVDMESGEAFKAALMALYSEGEKEIILDFRKVKFINSHCIGKILMFHKRFSEVGGHIYLTPLQGSIKEIFEALMLDKLIPEIKSAG